MFAFMRPLKNLIREPPNNIPRWLLHVGDAYYLRAELFDENHPVSMLAQLNAENNEARLHSLRRIKRLAYEESEQILLFGYHDYSEFQLPDLVIN